MKTNESNIFIIVEKTDVGSRDTVYMKTIGAASVYGTNPFPYFESESDAKKFIKQKKDYSYRDFEVLEMPKYCG